MRKLLIPSLALAAAAASPWPRLPRARARPAQRRRRPRLRQGLAEPRRGRCPHRRRRQPRLPALVRGRGEDQAVEGLRPLQRQGLRVRRRLRGREAARLHEGAGEVDGRALQQLVQAGQEAVRRLHHPGLVRARAREGRRLLDVVLLRQPGGRRPQGQADLEGQVGRRPQAVQARRAGRDDELHVHHEVHQALLEARSSSTRTTPRCRR